MEAKRGECFRKEGRNICCWVRQNTRPMHISEFWAKGQGTMDQGQLPLCLVLLSPLLM